MLFETEYYCLVLYRGCWLHFWFYTTLKIFNSKYLETGHKYLRRSPFLPRNMSPGPVITWLNPGEGALGWSFLVQSDGLTKAGWVLMKRMGRCFCLGRSKAILGRLVHSRALVGQVGRVSFEALPFVIHPTCILGFFRILTSISMSWGPPLHQWFQTFLQPHP